jgi:CheY-like chemotaxis protein
MRQVSDWVGAGRSAESGRFGEQSDHVGRGLVVDDSRMFRDVARSVLSAATRLRPLGEAASGEEAIRLLPDLKPDLVLLDVHMPGLDGVETAQAIHRKAPDTVVVLMSADADGLKETGRSAQAVAVLEKSDLFPQTLDKIWLQHGPDRRN